MLSPRKWLLSLGLLAVMPVSAWAGPLDYLKPSGSSAPPVVRGESQNQQTADLVKEALIGARLQGQDIQIECRGGVVSLTGLIADQDQRATATRVVSRVRGVREVDNRLRLMDAAPRTATGAEGVMQAGFESRQRGSVQQIQYSEAGPALDNQSVAQNVADAVSATGLTDFDIEVRYRDGECILAGAVDTREQALRVNQAAASVPGVERVVNRLTVAGRPVSVAPAPAPAQQAGYGPQFGPQGGPDPRMAQQYQQQMAQQMAIRQASAQQMQMQQGYGPQGGGVSPAGFHHGMQGGAHQVYNRPNLPDYAWPSQAPYDNSAQISYPTQYSASAFPYVGPFYPYPQVPLDWRSAQLVWDDGYWNLKFDSKTDKWFWFVNPKNWGK
ncbi:MAG: BON domain-containing protein [Planctomycetaceae bacterium]